MRIIGGEAAGLLLKVPPGYDVRPTPDLVRQAIFNSLADCVAGARVLDLFVADPPFGEKNIGRRSNSLSQKLLDDERLPGLLSATGLFVLGHTKRDTLTIPASWTEVKVMKHGDSMMRFLIPINRATQ